jgi:YHS domain-containing protein
MLQRMSILTVLAAGLFGLSHGTGAAQPEKKAKPEDQAKAKKALQDVQDFIGEWNLEGTQKVGAKTEAWKEKVNWGWKFKDGDAWLTVNFAEGKGKYFKDGELKYDVEGKKYVLTLNPAGKDEAKQVFEGTYAKGALTATRKDAKSGDVYRVKMNTLADGVRFAMKYEKQEGGKGLFADVYAMSGNKEGQGLAAGGAKKPECIVSGGAASIAVNYNGKTYYVCCSGCRDEFNADPKKYAK